LLASQDGQTEKKRGSSETEEKGDQFPSKTKKKEQKEKKGGRENNCLLLLGSGYKKNIKIKKAGAKKERGKGQERKKEREIRIPEAD